MSAHDDGELLALVLRLADAHVRHAESGLAELRGKGRGQFIADRTGELEAIRQRLAKAATVQANEGTLDRAHALMRDIERVHDSIDAAVTDAEVEMSRWRATAGVAS